MFFKEFIRNNKLEDAKNNSYTRYAVFYNKQLHIPVLIAIKTKGNELNIYMYDTDLPFASKEQLEDGSYKDLIISDYFCDDGLDFFIDDEPINTLNSIIFDGKPIIQGVQTRDKFVRHGLGSFALQLAQDYYEKKGCVCSDGKKRIYATKSNISADLVYANKFERILGDFGELLAHTKAKVKGQQQEKAYIKFLEKNNFFCEDEEFQIPNKPILRKRKLISRELLDEENKPDVVQCFGDIVDISGIIEDSHLIY